MAKKLRDNKGIELLEEVAEDAGLLVDSAHWTIQMVRVLERIDFFGMYGKKVVPDDISYVDFVRNLDEAGAEAIRSAALAYGSRRHKLFIEAPSEMNSDGGHTMSYSSGEHQANKVDATLPGFGEW